MASGDDSPIHGATPPDGASDRRSELVVFLTTTFLIIPGLAVAFVGTYGLVVWISQMIFGPPGPPS